jgi:hypothetical protein
VARPLYPRKLPRLSPPGAAAKGQKQTSGPIDDHDHFDTYFDDVQACDELLACLANGRTTAQL